MSDSSNPARVRRPLPKWKKALLVFSVIAVVVGAGLKGFAYFSDSNSGDPGRQLSTDPSKKSALDLNNSLVDGPGGTGSGAGDSPVEADGESSGATEAMSPLLMHGGISFFVGFCMGYAVRTFFKISAFFIGGALVLFFALQYFGVVPGLDWAWMEGHFQSLVSSLSKQMAGFKTFLEGHLPSSAAATAGAFTGWKKN